MRPPWPFGLFLKGPQLFGFYSSTLEKYLWKIQFFPRHIFCTYDHWIFWKSSIGSIDLKKMMGDHPEPGGLWEWNMLRLFIFQNRYIATPDRFSKECNCNIYWAEATAGCLNLTTTTAQWTYQCGFLGSYPGSPRKATSTALFGDELEGARFRWQARAEKKELEYQKHGKIIAFIASSSSGLWEMVMKYKATFCAILGA